MLERKQTQTGNGMSRKRKQIYESKFASGEVNFIHCSNDHVAGLDARIAWSVFNALAERGWIISSGALKMKTENENENNSLIQLGFRYSVHKSSDQREHIPILKKFIVKALLSSQVNKK